MWREQQSGKTGPGPLPATEHRNFFLHSIPAEEKAAGDIEERLRGRFRAPTVVEVLEDGLVRRQCAVDMLGIDADLATISPAKTTATGRQRIDQGAE